MRTKGLFGLSLLWVFSASILATIYLAWFAYPLEIEWLGLEKLTHLSGATISRNFGILMDYLTNPFTCRLSMPDFPSSKNGLHHFQAVKYLFHAAQAVFLLCLPAAIAFYRTVIKKGYLHLFRRALLALIFLPLAILGLAFLMGFDQFFIFFHQILFVGDSTWLFDPSQDPIIWVLPETFFLHAFVLFFLIFEGSLALLYGLAWWDMRKQT